ncbi:cytochrome P450 [Suillus discolor]|uniref:Cytochrome P450 n=1 Tax=Suillus discolor TaxID=1912936 RepID=A0A9P7JUN1_9AGAM|nr:cytochrome P450 [Suillus discolor]KAG2109960.1 cytochrome P450 [Suillus discolor]
MNKTVQLTPTIKFAPWHAGRTVLRWRSRTTQLRGPPRTSFIYGVSQYLASSQDSAAMYECWATEYSLRDQGSTENLLCNPRAIAHFCARETAIIFPRLFYISCRIGRGLLWPQGGTHRRQRKALAPAFSNAGIRKFIPVFYDSAYNAKGIWDIAIESSKDGNAAIEVQNYLDAVGIAGFFHDSGSLDWKRTSLTEVFDTFGSNQRASAVNQVFILLASAFPIITKIHTRQMNHRRKKGEKSIVGSLIKSEGPDAELHMSKHVVGSGLWRLLAGYETTSKRMLIELSRRSDKLLAFGVDPTYDQLKADLPYLHAVVHEILQFHPLVLEFTRLVTADDVIPLSEPGAHSVREKSQTTVSVRHPLTLIVDDPRTCLGKDFAIVEFKMVLSVLVKNFVFEMRDGLDISVEIARGDLPRPQVVGEDSIRVPLRVRWHE